MKIAATILSFLIISSTLFYYGYFDLMLMCSKEKASRNIAAAEHDHTFSVLRIPASQEDKYDDDEVRIGGNLYDIAERKIVNDTLYLSLYHDADEQNLLSVITDFFKGDDMASISNSPNMPSLKNNRIVYNPQYYFDALHFSHILNTNNFRNILKDISIASLPFYDILTPPPRLV